MSNTSNGPARKGSKHWMQQIVNDEKHNYKGKLDGQIGLGTINWLSPLKEENYSEYKLNRLPIIEHIGISRFSFWPANQPQWDAIGIAGKTLVLVEAKSHPGELNSKLSASSPESIELIKKSMKETFNSSYENGSFEKWTDKYYQLGNRLTFLYKLNQIIQTEKIDRIVLILLNIVNDPTLESDHRSTTLAEWESHYEKVLSEMTGSPKISNSDIKLIYFELKN